MWRGPREGDGRGGGGRGDEPDWGAAAGVARLVGQFMLLPLVTFVCAVEAFARAMREIQETSDRTLDLMTGRPFAPRERERNPPPLLLPPAPEPPRGWGGPAPGGPADFYANSFTGASAVEQGAQTFDQPTETEEREMSEHDLRGDDLKLIRWTISFIRRDLEVALDFGVDLIDYSTTEGDYQGSKKIEFVNTLKKGGGFERPDKWVDEEYPDAEYLETRDGKEYVIGLPPEDAEKFLRVKIEFLDRYEKEERDYKKVKIVK